MGVADRVFAGMLVFIPAAALAQYLHAAPGITFACAALAIIPLAKYIGEATEELTRYVGVALGGLLNATFGNAPELIVALFALGSGLTEVVKATIVGSILANLLLVLGSAIFLGGMHHRQQKFNATAAKSAGSTLLLVILALIMPATFLATSGVAENSPSVEMLSIIVALLLIVAYGASIVFSLWTHKHLYAREAADYIPRWSKGTCILVLCAAMLATAWVSDILVGSIEPLVVSIGWTQTFIGIVVLAIIGNAAEHATAARVALKDNLDLALQITIGSATQIAMFVAPILVIVSYFFTTQLNFVFSTFELAALILAVLVVNSIVEDGESNWFEGLLLLIGYIVVAAAFFLHP